MPTLETFQVKYLETGISDIELVRGTARNTPASFIPFIGLGYATCTAGYSEGAPSLGAPDSYAGEPLLDKVYPLMGRTFERLESSGPQVFFLGALFDIETGRFLMSPVRKPVQHTVLNLYEYLFNMVTFYSKYSLTLSDISQNFPTFLEDYKLGKAKLYEWFPYMFPDMQFTPDMENVFEVYLSPTAPQDKSMNNYAPFTANKWVDYALYGVANVLDMISSSISVIDHPNTWGPGTYNLLNEDEEDELDLAQDLQEFHRRSWALSSNLEIEELAKNLKFDSPSPISPEQLSKIKEIDRGMFKGSFPYTKYSAGFNDRFKDSAHAEFLHVLDLFEAIDKDPSIEQFNINPGHEIKYLFKSKGFSNTEIDQLTLKAMEGWSHGDMSMESLTVRKAAINAYKQKPTMMRSGMGRVGNSIYDGQIGDAAPVQFLHIQLKKFLKLFDGTAL